MTFSVNIRGLYMQQVIEGLERQIQEKHLLKHEFYRAWSEGKLSKNVLKDYALEYYHHVRAFATYIAGLLSHLEEDAQQTRKELFQNLFDEEAGNPNHPQLWRSFAVECGASEQELEEHTASPEIRHLIATFRTICRNGSTAAGLAALYAYESQIPEICVSKIAGLRQFYGWEHPKQWEYFTVHIAADQEHARAEREMLARHLHEKQIVEVKESVQQVLDALWNFLSSLVLKHGIHCQAA